MTDEIMMLFNGGIFLIALLTFIRSLIKDYTKK